MSADIVKADPTDDAEESHRVVEAARVPVLARGGGKSDLRDASSAATSTSSPARLARASWRRARRRSSSAPGASTRSSPAHRSGPATCSWSPASRPSGSWSSNPAPRPPPTWNGTCASSLRGGHHHDPFGYCNARVAEVRPAADDPIFLPFLYGSSQSAEYRAGFHGIAGWHGEGHLLRAVFEGVMFVHRRHVDVLRGAGVRFDTATLSGGGARSPFWPQILADGLGLHVRVAESRETGALGAAIGAGIGAGLFPDQRPALRR